MSKTEQTFPRTSFYIYIKPRKQWVGWVWKIKNQLKLNKLNNLRVKKKKVYLEGASEGPTSYSKQV